MPLLLLILFLLCAPIPTWAQEESVLPADSVTAPALAEDSLLKKKRGNPVVRFVKGVASTLFDVDEDYIEKEPYRLQTLLMNSNTYEIYRLADKEGNSIRFSPAMSMKVGPYFGYSLFFYGVTFDIAHLRQGAQRRATELSIYTLPFGVDLFYRKSGDNFRIRRLYLGDEVDTSPMKNVPFDGFTSTIKGFNTYYIFNHRNFSYPAAFNQATVQRRSSGSALAGIGYTHHSINIDWKRLNKVAEEHLGTEITSRFDSDAVFEKVNYTDISLSGGYAYNWVFAKNWVFASSLALALAYKRAVSDTDHEFISLRDFSFRNFNIDGIGRFGIVWNNMRWFAGANLFVHSYNYNKPQFYTNNAFGSFNLYFGMNFWRKKKK